MTQAPRRRCHRTARAWLALLCVSLCASVARPDAPTDLDRLMAALAQRQHSHVTFTERQYLALLDEPLESSGELFYDAPQRLEKRTLQPRRESLLFEDGKLSIQRGRRRHVLDLPQYPQLLPFIESIRATLAGERDTLERLFTLTFEGSFDHWALRLTPRDTALSSVVREVRIEGEAATIRTMEISQADGDRSLMSLGSEVPP